MKKITLLLFLLTAGFVFAQTPTSYSEITTLQTTVSNNTNVATITGVNGRLPIIGTFTNLGDLEAAIDENCVTADLVFEDMLGGPGGITPCGPTISSAGDGCYAAGEIQEGFISETTAGDMIAIPAGALGNADPLIGSSTFIESTIITFDPIVFAAGMEIWSNLDPTVFVRVFNPDGELIDELEVNVGIDTQTYVGLLSDEPIGSMEIEGANGSGELFTNFSYGAVCALNVNEVSLQSLISLYPNPASDIVTINKASDISIDSVSIYDTLGKLTSLQLVNGQVNISALTSGVYFMNINTSRGTLTQKIIKK